ncbi:hypothetical protein [Micromonospora sp. NPDC049497]|uniref:hypothetical protein n=1 Tax=Micromonospora sp. NPDC049497 TaxID=3364273 RepID=UPI0037BA4150
MAASAVSAVLLAVAGGCADDSPQRSVPRPSATAAAKDLKTWLREGAEKVGQDTFTVRLTMRHEGGVEGYLGGIELELDPARRRSTMTISFPIEQPGRPQWIEVKTVGTESWARFFGFGEPPAGWLPIDFSRIPADDSSLLLLRQVATDLPGLVETVVEPQRVTERAVRGSLDLRQHPLLGTALDRISPATDPTVPFSATLDPQDRITSLTIRFDQPVLDASEWRFLYSGFGNRLSIEPPADAEVLTPNDLDPRLLSFLRNAAPV